MRLQETRLRAVEPFPRHVVRRFDNLNFPLALLEGVHELRTYLDEVETEAVSKAIELGAGAPEIAEALGLSRQGAYYKIRAIQKRLQMIEDEDVVVLPDSETELAGN